MTDYSTTTTTTAHQLLPGDTVVRLGDDVLHPTVEVQATTFHGGTDRQQVMVWFTDGTSVKVPSFRVAWVR